MTKAGQVQILIKRSESAAEYEVVSRILGSSPAASPKRGAESSSLCTAETLEQTVKRARSKLEARAVSRGLSIDWRDDRMTVETGFGLDCRRVHSLLVTASRGAKRYRQRVAAETVLEGLSSGEQLLSERHGTDWASVEAVVVGALRGDPPSSGPRRRARARRG